ncbi:MAG: cryptochrome/photolyase family protein [Flavobacteriales bacterium]
MKIGLIFPHQLFEDVSIFMDCDEVYLIEERLFFRLYAFHQQKIAFHRSSMKCFEAYLRSKDLNVKYIESMDSLADIREFIFSLKNTTLICYRDTSDNWLEKYMQQSAQKANIQLVKHASLLFLNELSEFTTYKSKQRLFQTEFYKAQRTKRSILMEKDGSPSGGKWSFDEDNRKRYPKGVKPPIVETKVRNSFDLEAMEYVKTHFASNPGRCDAHLIYPTTYEESKSFLHEFFAVRFKDFGNYEDAILQEETVLNHSVISPLMNVGLLTPDYVIHEAIHFAEENNIPMNSLEGFVRQIVGWREFIRMVYELKGTEERTRNYWGFKRKIPASFWTGETGIPPIDQTIKKVLETGYCHHIERLMVLGNFMLLCEFDPDEVYRWFMELFIDAYDWVMVPNVYGMSQFADGGLMSTKPYISGSNYLMKMSNYEKGEWQTIWDGLFWHFLDKQRSFFLSNPRLGMLIHSFDKTSEDKRTAHLDHAKSFLARMDQASQ